MFGWIAMHIPDGFLSVPVSILLWLVVVGVVAYALRRVNRDMGEQQVPMMGVLAAAIFAGQMLNFPVAGGTSGHMLGAAIATILLGPWAAILVLTCVVSVQALLFQDGGLLALGSNVFNMAVIGVAVAYMVYETVQRVMGRRKLSVFVGGVLAAWFSIFISSLAAGLELAVSGTSPANVAVPAMAAIHALIGIGEALITLGALSFLFATRRDLLKLNGEEQSSGGKLVWVVGLCIAVGLAVLSPIASTHPDGLNWVAQQNGFAAKAQGPVVRLFSGYVFPGISNTSLATILAGILGTIVVAGVAFAVAYSRRRRRANSNSQPN